MSQPIKNEYQDIVKKVSFKFDSVENAKIDWSCNYNYNSEINELSDKVVLAVIAEIEKSKIAEKQVLINRIKDKFGIV
jgi:hypothetical protein